MPFIDDTGQSKRRGRPLNDALPLKVRLFREQLRALDTWREQQPDKPSRPEAVRRSLTEHLRQQPNPVIGVKVNEPRF